jgi:hypothetical protein
VEKRALDALSVFVLGTGLMLFLLAPCAGLYSLGQGSISSVATLVLGHSLRTYLSGFVDDDWHSRYH